MSNQSTTTAPRGGGRSGGKLLAVIELGTTSVRMVVAQTDANDKVHLLDSLQQPITLGTDTFTKGYIARETTERCVGALRRFDRVLQEYGIDAGGELRAVATSAVREAANRQAFLDRIFIATGIEVDDLDEAEVSRLTYLAVRPLLDAAQLGNEADVLVAEVGGGSTEVLQLHEGRIARAHNFRLGSLRLREMLEEFRTPAPQLRDILQTHVDRDVRQIVETLDMGRKRPHLVILGGDARFAADYLDRPAGPGGLTTLPVDALSGLTEAISPLEPEDIVRRHHISFPDAETLGPALLIVARLASRLRLKEVLVGQATLRDGLLYSMTSHEWWTREFMTQVLSSARELGRKFDVDPHHAENVASFARQLFQVLSGEHQLAPHYEVLLTVAALVHDVGLYVSTRSHHKHSMYLILNSEIFGLGTRDQLLTALIARYHRKATPRPTHEGYTNLDRESRVAVAKLASILRVADALDRQHRGHRRRPKMEIEEGNLVITFHTTGDLMLEKHAMESKGQMFKEVFGMDVVLRNARRALSDEH